MTIPEVIVNKHTLDRLRERHGLDVAHLDQRELRALAVTDVQEAIREGRRDDRNPRWGGASRRSPEGTTFAWTEELERIYVVRTGSSGRLFVTTVLNGSDGF